MDLDGIRAIMPIMPRFSSITLFSTFPDSNRESHARASIRPACYSSRHFLRVITTIAHVTITPMAGRLHCVDLFTNPAATAFSFGATM